MQQFSAEEGCNLIQCVIKVIKWKTKSTTPSEQFNNTIAKS
jgi:hypothetical protein